MNVIIAGSTGMIGNGVFYECLVNDDVKTILLINRNKLGISHKKVKEVILDDLFDLSIIEKEFVNYEACFFCVGVSSTGLSEENYMKITHSLPVAFAKTILKYNPKITFCYISAMGADVNQNSSSMWKRVKGKAENSLLSSGLENVYIFRPAITKTDKTSPKRTLTHKIALPIIAVTYPLLKMLFQKYCTTTKNIAKAMISVSKNPNAKKQFNVDDINKLANI